MRKTFMAGRARRRLTFCSLAVLLAGCAAGRREPAHIGATVALAGADTLRTREVAPGVRHLYVWEARGPWAVHVLEIDLERCRPVIEARKGRPPLAGRAPTSELAAGALAAVNADFFALPGGTPVEAHVSGGEVLIGPRGRPRFAVADRGWWIGPGALLGAAVQQADTVRLVQVNRPAAGDSAGAVLFTPWFGPATPAEPGAVAVAVRHRRGTATAGSGILVARDTLGAGLALDSGVVVLQAQGGAGRRLAGLRVGEAVSWHAAVVSASTGTDRAAVEAVGGYPVLLRTGRIAPDIEEGVSPAFGASRHPRTAVGVAAGGRRLLWVVVDGRQAPYSAGMTLAELAGLMQRLGADEALNLDGGGSSALVVDGRVVNRPSDPTGERPVGNALALVACRR